MQMPPTITFRRLSANEALEADIRRRLARLEAFVPTIIGARVLVEFETRHHRKGNRCHVRIDLTVPGEEILVTHETSLRPSLRARATERVRRSDLPDGSPRHAKVAVREAFEVARRRLQDFARRRRGAVKTHASAQAGSVPLAP